MAFITIPDPPTLRVEYTQDRAVQQLQRWAVELQRAMTTLTATTRRLSNEHIWPIRGVKLSFDSGTFTVLKSIGVQRVTSRASPFSGVDTRILWDRPFADEHYVVTFGVVDPDYTAARARIPQIIEQTREHLDVYMSRADGVYESAALTDNIIHVMAFGGEQ